MLSLRASPSGHHIVLIFRNAPLEIWSLPSVMGGLPQRTKVLDIPVCALDWLHPDPSEAPPGTRMFGSKPGGEWGHGCGGVRGDVGGEWEGHVWRSVWGGAIHVLTGLG